MFDRWMYLDRVYFVIAQERHALQKLILDNAESFDEKELSLVRETLELLNKTQNYFIQSINKI